MNIFDAIYCINLNKRSDRWKSMQDEFSKHEILNNVVRFSAVEKKDGRIGCLKSHIEILKLAKKNKYKNVLVFEDDIKILVDNFSDITKTAFEQLPEKWDLFYLGANLHRQLPNYSDNLVKILQGFTTHAICYNESVYDEIINKFNNVNEIKSINDIIDVWLSNTIQSRFNSFLVRPLLITQKNTYSDIEKNNIDYSFIEERYKKFVK